MPVSTINEKPSLVSELGALAGLYRTVFWMIGRKAHYGRIWPPEADMGTEEVTETPVVAHVATFEAARRTAVEAGRPE